MSTRREFLTTAASAVTGSFLGLPYSSAAIPSNAKDLIPVDITTLPDRIDRTDIFLLMGQSNMKGRGKVPQKQILDRRIVMMRMQEDRWYVAQDPMHARVNAKRPDRPDNAGVGPGLPFAWELAKRETSTRIGLIPCAIGGSRIGLWQKGGKNSLYDNALRRAKLALDKAPKESTKIRAVLWLQGESDSTEELHGSYESSLLQVVDNIRSDLNQPELPFIACTIGSFLKGHERFTHTRQINEILLSLPRKRPFTACVDARDLDGHIGDSVHYNTASQMIIGERFANCYFNILKS
jgi:hypothetical protein